MKKPGKLRIIGGQWRRRHLIFPDLPDLRPSPDAVRETLFNWLANDITDSVCLDLYAGSGAFGFEAASRGAKSVAMVESHHLAVNAINQSITALNAKNIVEIHNDSVAHYLQSTTGKFDLVFMDPPFSHACIAQTCISLVEYARLNDHALIYIESPKSNSPLPIPSLWHIIRESRKGMVQSTLFRT